MNHALTSRGYYTVPMGLGYLVLLAVVQGLTEFLPVSSSAHLILLPRLLETVDQGLRVDVAANTGTFLAVLVYFRREVAAMTVAALGASRDPARAADRRLAWLVGLGSVPVLVCGFLFRDLVATLGRDPVLIAVTSIGFGLLLAFADRYGRRTRALHDLTPVDAAFIGLAQALALVPGTSRSGITMTAGIAANLRRDQAARFSFLLAVPVGAAAAVWEAIGFVRDGEWGMWWQLLLVVVISALVGFGVIHFLLGFLRRRSLIGFAIYRIALGAVILAIVYGPWRG
ncbi:MAG TPA: undecaprenyl-diphosphate phosphatase [Thermoanaerobaculia bacterium]|jgi:undecaprenyl-diphosphatase|nr:undecaprenyl-diphosphate phosphatase [Thermoanaerobaculia bacterium]